MSEETGVFKSWRHGKMQDWIENEVTEWAIGQVTFHFGVDDTNELTKEQIIEVHDESGDLYDYDPTLARGFRNVVNMWEMENEDYL